ncbi:MAG: hypothetical protein ACC645_13635 [Pirellulales bacterium]
MLQNLSTLAVAATTEMVSVVSGIVSFSSRQTFTARVAAPPMKISNIEAPSHFRIETFS